MCIISALSQVLLKKASQREYQSPIIKYLNPLVVIAYILFFCVVVFNTYLLKHIPLILASTFSSSLPFVLSFVNGRIFFDEKINKWKIVGGCLILVGIMIVVI